MLSYQHSFHAGNLADLHKHVVLTALWATLKRKPRPLSYFDTHAGRGFYNLDDEKATKTNEAVDGIGQYTGGATVFDTALSAAKARFGHDQPNFYAGSPALIAATADEGDVLTLCELHPQEHAALRQNLAGVANIQHRDGYAAVNALTPMKPRRGLVFIDPSYELESDYTNMPKIVGQLLRKWPEVVVAIWYPMLGNLNYKNMTAKLETQTGIVSEAHFRPGKLRMTGSGMLIINAPFGAKAAIGEALGAIKPPYARVATT